VYSLPILKKKKKEKNYYYFFIINDLTWYVLLDYFILFYFIFNSIAFIFKIIGCMDVTSVNI